MSARVDPEPMALGILPAGRCNNLAGALGLPEAPAEVAESLADGALIPIDLGRIEERYYATVANLGFESEMAEYVDLGSPPSFLGGTAAYVFGMLVTLVRYRSRRVRQKGTSASLRGPSSLRPWATPRPTAGSS